MRAHCTRRPAGATVGLWPPGRCPRARRPAHQPCVLAAAPAPPPNPATTASPADPTPTPTPSASSPADAWYTAPLPIPRHIGGIQIAILEGKGRGVVAVRDLAAGEVVMATPPLALVTSPVRQRPSGELVVDAVLQRPGGLYGSSWFSVLYDGSPRSCKAALALQPSGGADGSAAAAAAATAAAAAAGSDGSGEPHHPLPPEPVLPAPSAPSASAPSPPPKAAAKAKGFLATRASARRGGAKAPHPPTPDPAPSSAPTSPSSAPPPPPPPPLPDRREQTRLAKVVKFNCFGDDAEDLAACACRGEAPRGHIGLWPEFALFNHSCAPNAVNYCVGGTMVVRACQPIRQGEEVTICYLGRPQLLPFQRRIAALQQDYGFECDCVRCTAEQAHYDKVADVYGELAEAVEERLGPAFLAAVEAGDLAAVEEVAAEAQGWLRRLYGLFRKTLLAPDVRQYVMASLYDVYELLMGCSAALGRGEDASSLQACLKSIELVSAGSDLHVILAVRYHDWALAEHGPASPLAALARGSLRRAHVARYGPVSEALLQRLVEQQRLLHINA